MFVQIKVSGSKNAKRTPLCVNKLSLLVIPILNPRPRGQLLKLVLRQASLGQHLLEVPGIHANNKPIGADRNRHCDRLFIKAQDHDGAACLLLSLETNKVTNRRCGLGNFGKLALHNALVFEVKGMLGNGVLVPRLLGPLFQPDND